jgi:hypothetical protein
VAFTVTSRPRSLVEEVQFLQEIQAKLERAAWGISRVVEHLSNAPSTEPVREDLLAGTATLLENKMQECLVQS